MNKLVSILLITTSLISTAFAGEDGTSSRATGEDGTSSIIACIMKGIEGIEGILSSMTSIV